MLESVRNSCTYDRPRSHLLKLAELDERVALALEGAPNQGVISVKLPPTRHSVVALLYAALKVAHFKAHRSPLGRTGGGKLVSKEQ